MSDEANSPKLQAESSRLFLQSKWTEFACIDYSLSQSHRVDNLLGSVSNSSNLTELSVAFT